MVNNGAGFSVPDLLPDLRRLGRAFLGVLPVGLYRGQGGARFSCRFCSGTLVPLSSVVAEMIAAVPIQSKDATGGTVAYAWPHPSRLKFDPSPEVARKQAAPGAAVSCRAAVDG